MSYLTKGERINYLVALGAHEVIERWTDDKKNHLTKDEKKYLRMASSLIEKAAKLMINRLDPDFVDRLVSDSKNNYLTIIPTRATTPPNESRVKTDTLFNLSNFALLHCQANESCFMRDDWKSCELYKAMMELDIPVANFEKGKCPYKL